MTTTARDTLEQRIRDLADAELTRIPQRALRDCEDWDSAFEELESDATTAGDS
jgi:hypothetical protein